MENVDQTELSAALSEFQLNWHIEHNMLSIWRLAIDELYILFLLFAPAL
jgi:hypothetical protein